MPEQSPDSGEEIVRTLVADEQRHDLPADEPSLLIAAVEAGPEIAHNRRRRKGLGIGAWLAIIWISLLLFSAIFQPLLVSTGVIPDPEAQELPEISGTGEALVVAQPPSLGHLMGLNPRGEDILSLVIEGSRRSLVIGFVSVFLGFMVGGFLGLLAGYFKGRTGGFIGSLLDILLAFPQLILALFVVEVLGHTVTNVTFALAIVSTPVLARIARASSLSWSEREFVVAARAQGAKHRRVLWREVLPNTLPAMLSIALLGVAVVIVAEAGLALLGAGVAPDLVTWGNIIQTGVPELKDSPHIVLAPSIVIFLTVLALNYLGDVVRARFDVREAAL
ncbi:MAG: ABC transporter permease [Actinobacteria bacterium]|nr:ABC transporter permease [Actinomycetota bacterium]